MFADISHLTGSFSIKRLPVALRAAALTRRAVAATEPLRARTIAVAEPLRARVIAVTGPLTVHAAAVARPIGASAAVLAKPLSERVLALAEILGFRASRSRFPIEKLQPNGRLWLYILAIAIAFTAGAAIDFKTGTNAAPQDLTLVSVPIFAIVAVVTFVITIAVVAINQLSSIGRRLQTSDEHYQLAAAAIHGGLWHWDIVEGTEIYSRHWMAILGYSDEEIDGAWQSAKSILKTAFAPARRCAIICTRKYRMTSKFAYSTTAANMYGFSQKVRRCGTKMANRFAWRGRLAKLPISCGPRTRSAAARIRCAPSPITARR